MGLKDGVNRALNRTTGYTLVSDEQLRSQRAKLERARARARAAEEKLKRRPPPPPKPKPQPKPKPKVPGHYDEDAKRVIETVRERTMTAHQKLFALIEATRYVVDHQIPGAFVECGVWRGGSMQAAALSLLGRGVSDRELHLFDTFEGMPEPTAKDTNYAGKPAAELLATQPRTARVWAVAGLDDVREGMAGTGYPEERIHYHEGRVEETIPEQAPEQIALLRLDTDWYESTRHELAHLYDRVPSGGVVIFDDYGTWQGARQAVDEFLAETGARLLLVPVAAGRFTVKP